MPTSPNTSIGATYQINNTKMVAPTEGPRALVAFLNFTSGASQATVDLTQQTQPPAQLSVIQGVFIDNHAGTVDILMQQVQTAQIIVCKAGQQIYTPVFAAATPVFNFVGGGGASPGIVIPVYFYNVPISPLTLGSQAIQGLNFNGNNLLVQDTAVENALSQLTALITNQGSGNGLDVNVISGGGGGGSTSGPYQWHGVNVGSGATVYTPAAGKRFYINNIKVLMDPGATRAAGQNNFAIQDGGSFVIQAFWQDTATYTAGNAAGPIVLFSADDMGWLSTTVDNSVLFTINHNMGSANAIYMNFSTLIGDHA